jgi:hypothetical protein
MTSLALERGHTLTFFNRGKTHTDKFPEIERIKGDRNGQIDGLKDRQWDVVIDNSGYVPRHARATAELLAPNVRQYIFTSSVSVYPNFTEPRDEKSPVGKLQDETVEKVDGDTYGPLKALCEQAVEKAMPGRTCVIARASSSAPTTTPIASLTGPARAARGGEFIAPGAPGTIRSRIIDVRDLARPSPDQAAEENVTAPTTWVSKRQRLSSSRASPPRVSPPPTSRPNRRSRRRPCGSRPSSLEVAEGGAWSECRVVAREGRTRPRFSSATQQCGRAGQGD